MSTVKENLANFADVLRNAFPTYQPSSEKDERKRTLMHTKEAVERYTDEAIKKFQIDSSFDLFSQAPQLTGDVEQLAADGKRYWVEEVDKVKLVNDVSLENFVILLFDKHPGEWDRMTRLYAARGITSIVEKCDCEHHSPLHTIALMGFVQMCLCEDENAADLTMLHDHIFSFILGLLYAILIQEGCPPDISRCSELAERSTHLLTELQAKTLSSP